MRGGSERVIGKGASLISVTTPVQYKAARKQTIHSACECSSMELLVIRVYCTAEVLHTRSSEKKRGERSLLPGHQKLKAFGTSSRPCIATNNVSGFSKGVDKLAIV
ncbi:hypothetical protein BaRGS_00026948 [Batillaria attramentaria]|uniref:Uncharacterized protein n=1 Tax=Batillaria attramentaria TaxID=370345 RepID=A0ABD0K4P6_9CAEN